jgi:glycerol-3-phosphate acyltransferase PlsY
MVVTLLVCAALAFLLGALPFAVWLGQALGGSDVRAVGDGNPGTANAFKAGGWRAGVPSLVLEVGKAGVPVGVANLVLGLSPWALVPVALAPILGHVFSPFLGFKGGKAIATTFGTWAGLTGFTGPLALALCMAFWYALQTVDAWTVAGGLLFFGVFLVVTGAPLALVVVWFLNFGILIWTHRSELSLAFSPRGWLRFGGRLSR